MVYLQLLIAGVMILSVFSCYRADPGYCDAQRSVIGKYCNPSGEQLVILGSGRYQLYLMDTLLSEGPYKIISYKDNFNIKLSSFRSSVVGYISESGGFTDAYEINHVTARIYFHTLNCTVEIIPFEEDSNLDFNICN